MKAFWIVGCSTLLSVGLVTGKTVSVYGAEGPQQKAEVKPAVAQTSPTANDQVKFFDEKVRPIFAQNCYKCHTTDSMGGLRLDSRDAILSGGDSGPAVVPG